MERCVAKNMVYIVSTIGWEYNDEVYSRFGLAGTPVRGYTTRARAQKEVDRLNAPLLNKKAAGKYRRECLGDEEGDEYGTVAITENYEVVAVEMGD